MVAANVLNKQSRAAENGWFFRGDYARFLTPLIIKFDLLRNVTEDLKFASLFQLSMDRDKDQAC
jgi:hypothetical protein